MTLTITPLPPTKIEPVTEILHGVIVTDPYRWLEDQNSPKTRKWLAEQTTYARSYLDEIPGRDRIRKRVEDLLSAEIVSEPWKVGSRYFYLKRKAYQEQPAIAMREGNSADEIVLVNPADMNQGSATSVSILKISPDGNLLAYGIRRDGRDSQSVEFLDVSRKQVLPDRLPNGSGPGLVFSPDGRGFYYSHEVVGSLHPNYRAIYMHQFGSRPEEDSEIFFAGEDRNLHVGLFGSSDGEILAYLVSRSNDPITFELYVQHVSSGKKPRRIVEGAQPIFVPFYVGHSLLALTDRRAPNRRIVSIDADHPEPDHWQDIVPEAQQRIEGFAAVGSFVAVSYLENRFSRIEAFNVKGGRQKPIPCPPQGTARLIRRPLESDTLFYDFCTFAQPSMIFSYEPESGEHKVWAETRVSFDSSSIKVEQIRYKSSDGTEVPMFLVMHNKRPSSGSRPTLLTAYGGFGFNHTPQFKASYAFLLEQGFLFAIANIRGGGEFGEEWHLAGKRHQRQKAVDDFISAAEWLVQNGHASRGKIAISGGSNAGLLVGAALTQRPELFRAVVCSGPLLDMLRYHRFDLANRWIDEYGSSDNKEDFPYLLAYSPYHRVEDGGTYPAVMLISGDADTRCNPMHARKMTAKLQAATTSKCPVLLNYNASWGHMPVQPLTRRIDFLTDRLGFICHELGVRV